jgi:hypothetical protein
VSIAYVVFYYIGVPLLVYAYWRRGGKYQTRTYWGLGILGGGFVVLIVIVALIGAAVGPVDTIESATTADDSALSTPDPAPEFSVRISYSDAWQVALSVTGSGTSQSESISGRRTETIEITGSVGIISVNAQKQDDTGNELTVQILHTGDVVAEASTRSAYGLAQASQSF